MIINHHCASVDNHIPGDDIFDYPTLKNVIFIYYHPLEKVTIFFSPNNIPSFKEYISSSSELLSNNSLFGGQL